MSVHCDGDFDYSTAPDLRTALGWKVATDGGRERIIEGFDLDEATRCILAVIERHGTDKGNFFGSYGTVVQETIVVDRTSRFGDGYCGAKTVLWQVATRQLGVAHEGYPFMY